MVSTKALTIKAKLVMHKAIKPTPVPIPKDENRIKAHTKVGMFLKKVAKPRTNLAVLGKGEIFSLPNKAVTKARIAAIVVDAIARANVTNILSITSGKRFIFGSFGGKKSSLTNFQIESPFANKVKVTIKNPV